MLPPFIIKQVNLPWAAPVSPSCISSKILKQAPECTIGSALKSGHPNNIWTCLSLLQGRPGLFPNRTETPDGGRSGTASRASTQPLSKSKQPGGPFG